MIGAETKVGDLGFELIQPVSGPSIYQEYLDTYGEGVQHIACMKHNDADSDLLKEHWRERGADVLMSGRIGEIDRVLLPGHRPDHQVGAGVRERSRHRAEAELRLPVMPADPPVRVLAIGDPYMPVGSFAEALASLGEAVTVTQMQISRTDAEPPRTPSEHRLREYAGDPAEVARAAAGHEVLVLHGAPVSAEVLDTPGLRLVCCARGGPVNVDVAAATERGIPVASTPGKNAEAVAELTIAFALMLIRGVPRASRYIAGGGRLAESRVRGPGVLRPGGSAAPSSAWSASAMSAARSRAGRSRSASRSSRMTRSRPPPCRTASPWSASTRCSPTPTSCPCTPGRRRTTGTSSAPRSSRR